MCQTRIGGGAEQRVLISPETFGTSSSRPRYRVASRRSAQPDLRPSCQLTELRIGENREEETDRSSQNPSRDHQTARKTRPCRINRGDRTRLRKFPRKPCKTHRTHSQSGSASRSRIRTPQNLCS